MLGLFGLLIAANAAAGAWALAAFHDRPALLGTSLLAWSLGLRHAVDADHIAAIDNVTRKLMQEGRQPLTVGLFFALGHSTVVALASAGLAAAVPLLGDRLDVVSRIGGTVGALVSVFFLLVIAAYNFVVVRSLWLGQAPEVDGGPLTRLGRPLFGLIARPWHMYLLGALFGLGFDTATEVALLGLSASQAAQGMSPWTILVFPALFAAAMALVDTADGVLMNRAYGWALARPERRSTYNLAVTLVSVVVAVGVAGLVLLGLVSDRWGRSGGFWDTIAGLNDNADGVGLVIVGVFVAMWIGAAVLYRATRPQQGGAAAD
ncbi:MAG TPA: HoxN/HupN/NixA family nickel/cobalt transporter [Reyranella sp.]|nr:HoxN/HupN/NixA family nickel/cobalt transporter [Reyranella sp.]